MAIVYTSTVREAEKLSRILNINGFSVRHYHGRMPSQAREEVQELFREGIIKIIIATKAFGMGIDKSDVRYVIHYDIPGDIESYFQEAGRAGRDGETAYCVLLYHKGDLSTQQYFIQSAFPDEVELNSLLLSIRDRWSGTGPIHVSPDDIANDSGLDIERLDIALHILEKLKFIHRSFNFTLKANVLLNRSVGWIASKLGGEKALLLTQLTKMFGISDKQGVQLDLLTAAQNLGVNPVFIDQVLTHLSSEGWAVYRPWDRGYIIEPLEKISTGGFAKLVETDIQKLLILMNKNLKRMMRYAENLGPGDCRRRYILEHFGEQLDQKITPCCNLCESSSGYPWSEVSTGDLAQLSNEIDPPYIALRTVEWNESLSSEKKSSPYTIKTLTHILVGNTYAATKMIIDPIKKARRIRKLESSPYFGILQGYPGGSKSLERVLTRLEIEGFVQLESITFNKNDDGIVEYKAPILTQRGRQQILDGKYIGN